MKKINVTHTTEYWTCGDGCCDHERLTTVIEYNGKEFVYESDYDSDNQSHLLKFLKEAGIVEFDIYEVIIHEDDSSLEDLDWDD